MIKIRLALLSILLMLLSMTCFGQWQYDFDKLVNYTFSGEYFPDQKRTHLFNSKDDSYYMQLYNRNDSLISRVFDAKTNEVHYFNVDKQDSLRLAYFKSDSFPKITTNYRFDFSKRQKKTSDNDYVFKIYDSTNSRIAKLKLKMRESELDLFFIYKCSAFEGFLNTEITPPFNGIVLESKGRNTSNNFFKYKLDNINDVKI